MYASRIETLTLPLCKGGVVKQQQAGRGRTLYTNWQRTVGILAH